LGAIALQVSTTSERPSAQIDEQLAEELPEEEVELAEAGSPL
jgi:hypothetical protein